MGDQEKPESSGRTRRRGAELVHAIHEAAIEEVVEVGIGRLTMEGIAKRARTARTVLYRRWPSPEEILLDALCVVYPQETPTPEADDLRGDLLRSLRLMLEWWTEQPAARAMGEIMLQRHRHPELVDRLYQRVFDPHGGRFTLTVLRHYAERGVIDSARLTPVVADIGEALVMKFLIDNARPPGDAWITAIVDQAILPALGLSGADPDAGGPKNTAE